MSEHTGPWRDPQAGHQPAPPPAPHPAGGAPSSAAVPFAAAPAQYPPAQYPPAQYPAAQYPAAQYPAAQYSAAQYPPAQAPSANYAPALFPMSYKDTAAAYLLWFFLGGIGAHKFYLRSAGLGALYVCLSVIGVATSWLGVGFLLLVPLWVLLIIDAFLIPGRIRELNARTHTHNSSIGAR